MGDARPKTCNIGVRWAARPRVAATVAVAALSLVIAGCAHTSRPRSVATHPAHAASRLGADQVCAHFATTALSSDTVIDQNPSDARRRAAELFGTSALTAQFVGQTGDDPQWAALVAHEATVTVTASPVIDDPPPITSTQAAAGVIAHQTAMGLHGWHELLPDVVVYCTLAATGTTWTVTGVTFSDDGTSAAPTTTRATS